MSASDLPTSAAIPHHADRLTEPRDFAGLHRDVWAVVRSNPMVFVVLPALLWLPFDLLAEWASLATGDDLFSQLRTTQRVGRIGELIAGTLVPSIVLFALKEGMGGRRVTVKESLAGGFKNWGPTFSALFAAGVYAVLGFLLLIIPGFFATARASLAPVVNTFENRTGGDALKRSIDIVKERGMGKIMLWGFSAYCIYIVLTSAFAMGVGTLEAVFELPETALVNALSGVPVNLLMVGILVGTAIVYIDAVGVTASYPLGRELSHDDGSRIAPPATTGTRGLVTAAVIAGLALPIIAGTVMYAVQGEDELIIESDFAADDDWPPIPEAEFDAAAAQLEAQPTP